MNQLLFEFMKLFSIICILPLVCTTAVSLVVSFFQTITQIQDQSLLFLVKLFSILGFIFFTGSYATELIGTFTASVFEMLVTS